MNEELSPKSLCLPKEQMINIQNLLRERCLCHLSVVDTKNLQQNLCTLWVEDVLSILDSDYNRDHVLAVVSTIQFTCEFFTRQYCSDTICSKIAAAYDSLKVHHNFAATQLTKLLGSEHSDQFVCFAVSRALSSMLLLLAGGEVYRTNLEVLIRSLVLSEDEIENEKLTPEYLRKLTYSLEVVKRIVDWKELLEIDEECGLISSSNCAVITHSKSSESDTDNCVDSFQVWCIEALGDEWPAIVNGFCSLLLRYDERYECAIVIFMDLWRSTISIFEPFAFEPFYQGLEQILSLLSVNIPSILWELTVDLFNKSLRHNKWLAVTDESGDNQYSIAIQVVNDVCKKKKGILLNKIPSKRGNGFFESGDGAGDKLLLRKVTLLLLKSVAVVAKRLRSDLSSNSSYGSGAETRMKLTVRKLRMVLSHLDNVVKEFAHIAPQTNLTSWMVSLFEDQDDYLIEGMLHCLNACVALNYCRREQQFAPAVFCDIQSLERSLNPTETFLNFIKAVGESPEMLLDFLISNETCFLLYFHTLLKCHVIRCWPEFTSTCGADLVDVMDMFNHLRETILNLQNKRLFPYEIRPVLRNLQKCKELYEG